MRFVKRSLLPTPVKGKVGTLSVGITGNGQVQLTKMAMEALGEPKAVVVAFDEKSNKLCLFRTDAPFVTKSKVDAKDYTPISRPKKGNGGFFSGAAMFRDADIFGDHIYDFKASGNQNFKPEYDSKNQALVFELPKGAVAPKPVVRRKKSAAVGVAAEVKSTEGTPVTQSGESDFELTLDAA